MTTRNPTAASDLYVASDLSGPRAPDDAAWVRRGCIREAVQHLSLPVSLAQIAQRSVHYQIGLLFTHSILG